MIKKYEKFVIHKSVNEALIEMTNEGVIGNAFKNLWHSFVYKIKSIFGDRSEAWREYNKWAAQNGFNQHPNTKKPFCEFFIKGEDVDYMAPDPKAADVFGKLLSDFRARPLEKEPTIYKYEGPDAAQDTTAQVQDEIESSAPTAQAQVQEVQPKDEEDFEDKYRQHMGVTEGMEHPDQDVDNVSMKELQSWVADQYEMRIWHGKKMAEKGKKGGGLMCSTFVWGAPGLGKTEGVKQFCKKKGIDIMIWNLSTCEPTDFIGVPDIEELTTKTGTKHKRTVNRPPMIFPPEDIETGGILFLDEMNRANSAVLGASLTLILEGRVGTYHLPATWQVIAAGNRSSDASSVSEIDSALGGRFSHINLVTTPTEWVNDWAIYETDMYPGVIAFIQFAPEMFHNQTEESNYNWANPRNWEKLGLFLTMKEEAKGRPLDRQEIKSFSHKIVGLEAAALFSEFMDIKDSFTEKDMEDVYTQPDKAKQIPIKFKVKNKEGKVTGEKVDNLKSLGIAMFIAMFKRPQTKKERLPIEQAKNVIKYCLKQDNVEIASALLNYLNKTHPYLKDEEPYRKEWLQLVKDWHQAYKKDLKID